MSSITLWLSFCEKIRKKADASFTKNKSHFITSDILVISSYNQNRTHFMFGRYFCSLRFSTKVQQYTTIYNNNIQQYYLLLLLHIHYQRGAVNICRTREMFCFDSFTLWYFKKTTLCWNDIQCPNNYVSKKEHLHIRTIGSYILKYCASPTFNLGQYICIFDTWPPLPSKNAQHQFTIILSPATGGNRLFYVSHLSSSSDSLSISS